MKSKLYNQKGKIIGEVELPVEIFGLKINPDLVHQAVVAQLASSRQVLAHTKGRGQVRGGGRKPWRQKGTGRARHGSIRSPLWRGGGITFGPTKERVFAKKINKKMKRQALFMVLSGKAKDDELILLNDLKIERPETREIVEIIKNLKLGLNKAEGSKIKKVLDKGTLIILPKKDDNIIRAARNIPTVSTIGADSLNVVDLLSYKYLLMPKEAINVIKNTFLTQD